MKSWPNCNNIRHQIKRKLSEHEKDKNFKEDEKKKDKEISNEE